MSDNLRHWNRFADIDPAFTKPITGKAYKGTSPNPQYVIRCLTDIFGPVGEGFGWRVLAEDFTALGPETLHWCRIEFWHTDRGNTFEAYGQTKAAYTTAKGHFMVDEDAPKKSLTDAIIKAASQIGIAANIFLGRWDDQKYVAQVEAQQKAAQTADPAIEYLTEAESLDDLKERWGKLPAATQRIPAVIKAKDARKDALMPKPAAPDLGGDHVPY